MKKYIALLLMLTVTACSNNVSSSETPSDSPFNTETNTDTINSSTDTNLNENTNTSNSATTVNASIDTTAASTITEETIENYYKMVAEEKAIEADIEKLEQQFHTKAIDANTFQSQKTALKQQENTLEAQIDALEYQIPISLPQNWVDTTNMEQMIQKLKEVELAEKQLELSLDQAEQNYINNTISREDYISQVIELEKQNDIFDKQDDILEEALEALGWDD